MIRIPEEIISFDCRREAAIDAHGYAMRRMSIRIELPCATDDHEVQRIVDLCWPAIPAGFRRVSKHVTTKPLAAEFSCLDMEEIRADA